MNTRFLCFTLIFAAMPALSCSMEGVAVTPEKFGLVKIGMTVAEAAKATGGAVREPEFGRPAEDCYYGQFVSHGEAVMNMVVENDKITSFEVYEPDIHTAEKIGVGSSAEAVKEAFEGKWKAIPKEDSEERDIRVEEGDGRGYLFVIESGKVVQYNAGILSAVLNGLEGCL
jgi:hypothetical protein